MNDGVLGMPHLCVLHHHRCSRTIMWLCCALYAGGYGSFNMRFRNLGLCWTVGCNEVIIDYGFDAIIKIFL